jgi:large subunit ribosomal protein L25|tara:strand:+ start:3082 stop:3720 length:639 start_codon:yes stop_codon:yes gene_type:complete
MERTMAETMKLSAIKRDRAGKGSARAARRDGLIPAVIYGDRKEPLSITLDANTFRKLVNQPGIFRQILSIEVEGSSTDVLPRDIQFHPVTDIPLHVDFLRVAKDAKVTVMVAVEYINDDKSPGLKTGGVLNVVRYEVEVNSPANAIPEKFVIDLEGTQVGDSIHISAVTMPEGVTPTITDRDFTVATIAAPMGETVEEDTDEEATEETEAEE